ncbi:MAG: Transposase IS116/IS110/IS902 family protein [Candidatus Udaeobacter sp.]|jgi:transposase|nr:MAG: Transposase IS116/IS110/IS902 family protein [Candidatus Udaeobacter sp.]
MKKKSPVYTALDLHSRHSVLGSMEHGGKTGARIRFATEAETLRAQVARLRQARRPLFLTMEAGALTRWASGIVRPLVERLIICEPRHNRLINSNPTKSDEADVEGMCLLLRLGKLKEVWMGQDRTREIYRALVYELLNWRDAQRELKGLIKARYRQWGVLRLHGIKVFSVKGRKDYLDQLPAEEERRMMRRLYSQLDHAIAQWKETLQEVERLGGEFWEVRQFQRIPGVGPMAAHVFSAIIEEPSRFGSKFKLWKYSQLAITDRTSDHKPLGYQRLDRRGNAELKNLSYHAWRTACKSTTGPNPIKAFYQQSRLRTGSVRHARLNTQRKILEAMWLIWLRRRPFDPNKFAQTQPTPLKEQAAVESKGSKTKVTAKH